MPRGHAWARESHRDCVQQELPPAYRDDSETENDRLKIYHKSVVQQPNDGVQDVREARSLPNSFDIEENPAKGGNGDDGIRPTGRMRRIGIITSLILTCLLMALDETILSNAIPTITQHFHSIEDIGWYAAAFSLTASAFQLPFGKAYSLFNIKHLYIASAAIFLLGNVICATASNSVTLIVGRAISGIGGSGIHAGGPIIIARTIPIRTRGLYLGLITAVMSIGVALGPLLSGVLTQNLSWRWCFWISLPFGGLAISFALFGLPGDIGQSVSGSEKRSLWLKLRALRPLGCILLVASISCLVLALQWGGSEQGGWRAARTIVCLVVFGCAIIFWAGIQYSQGDGAMVPWRVTKQRTVASAGMYTFLGQTAMTMVTYYLAIWFQVVKDENPEQSGIHTIPMFITMVFMSLLAGAIAYATGYYAICLLLGAILTPVGALLLTRVKVDTNVAAWTGYEILFAIGIGVGISQCNAAAQVVLPDDMIPIGTSLIGFYALIAATTGSAIGQAVFQTILMSRMRDITGSGTYTFGSTGFLRAAKEKYGPNSSTYRQMLEATNYALTRTFLGALVISCLLLPCALLVEWKSIKKSGKDDGERDADHK